MKNTISQYESLYNPRMSVPEFEQIAARWMQESARARATLDCYLDVPYGNSDMECMDIFRSQGPSKGMLMFIHGGYWRAQDKAAYSLLATSLTRAGITVAIPNYALCPSVEIRDIVMQMVQACAWLYRNGSHFGAPSDRLFVCGHSAGGHLTAMMLACLWPVYAADLPVKTVKAGLSISGLFDLRDIIKVRSINNDVRLTPARAIQASPAFLPPASDAPLYLAVGGDETGGFHRQHRSIIRNWKKVIAADIPCPGDNHFTVLDTFTRTDSNLFKKTVEMVGT